MNDPLNPVKVIYVALNCLLDTRMGAMVSISPDFSYEVTTAPEYFTREEDRFSSPSFGALAPAQLKAVQQQLPQTVLKNSLMTRMPHFIRELAGQLTLRGIGTPFAMKVEVQVNTYPFILNDEEAEQMVQALAYRFGQKYRVSLIHQAFETITLKYARAHYAAMVMYDYHEWLNLYDLEMKKHPLVEFGVYVPRLYFGDPPPPEALQSFVDNNTDPFVFSAQVLAPLVMIQYLPIALFCVDMPGNPG